METIGSLRTTLHKVLTVVGTVIKLQDFYLLLQRRERFSVSIVLTSNFVQALRAYPRPKQLISLINLTNLFIIEMIHLGIEPPLDTITEFIIYIMSQNIFSGFNCATRNEQLGKQRRRRLLTFRCLIS